MPTQSFRRTLALLLSTWAFLNSCVTLDNSSKNHNKPRQSFLWEATKGENTMTLVGTMHIGIRESDMDPKLWKRLDASDTVIIETDISRADPVLMGRYLNLPPHQSLRSLVGDEYWKKLLAVVEDASSPIGEKQLDRLSPLAVGALLLQMQAKADDEIAEGQVSIDQIIFERGRSLGKATHTLESNEEQLESLKAVFTVEAVQKVLDDWDAEDESYGTMKKAFKDGDSEALDELLAEIPEEMHQLLLVKRNLNWMTRLPKLKGRHTVLAVGAAHFPGPSGLLELLRKEGYTIQRVQ